MLRDKAEENDPAFRYKLGHSIKEFLSRLYSPSAWLFESKALSAAVSVPCADSEILQSTSLIILPYPSYSLPPILCIP